MTNYRAAATIFFLSMSVCVCLAQWAVWAQAGTITKSMQNNCVNDYKKFCGDSAAIGCLNLCMKKAGPSLSPACVQALVQAGKVSQAEVNRVKAQMKGR